MKKQADFYDKFLNKFKYIGISLGLILLLLTWGLIPEIILLILNIDPDTLPFSITVLYTTIFDIALLILLISFYKQEIKQEFKNFFNKNNITKNLKTSLYYWSLGLAVMITCNLIIATITPEIAANESAVREMIDKVPLYMAFQVMIYAPISEEIIFRKSIAKIFKNKYFYILTSGLIFGGLHVISSLTSITDLLYILPYSALGITFALLYKKTNNIFSTITAHSIHNTLAFILYLITI